MFIERPPLFYRMMFPETIWRLPCKEKTIYLTFDDGPVPVGENVARNTELYAEILKRGHHTGNHTMNHIQGMKYSIKDYVRNVDAANELIQSALFRPPHGHMCLGQAHELRQKYKIIMWDVVTRDYSKKLSGEQVFNNVKKYTRNGSIIVFHDSLKGQKNLRYALPKSIEWIKEQGYKFALL